MSIIRTVLGAIVGNVCNLCGAINPPRTGRLHPLREVDVNLQFHRIARRERRSRAGLISDAQ